MTNDDFKQAALEYHRLSPPGKIKVAPTKPMPTVGAPPRAPFNPTGS